MIRAFQWDLARQVERLDALVDLLPKYAAWGYRELYLHLEDAVEYPSLPSVARPDAYRYSELQKLVAAATRVGIGVVPIVNLLGHTQYLIKTPELRELNELRNEAGHPLANGQICPLHPRTLEVADALLADMARFCTAGKVHVGLDESFHLGKCPKCRAEIERIGLAKHFSGHVRRLHSLTQKRGLRMGLWADMLYFVPSAIEELPAGLVAYDWYYYPFGRAPRVELFNFAEADLAPRLKRRGIEYWGCPMNGAFRYEPVPIFSERLANIRSWWRRCKRVKAGGLLITSWEAYRLAFETTTVVDAAASELWQRSEKIDDLAALTSGFEKVFGLNRTDARLNAQAALGSDLYPFAGYARWEANERWDVRAVVDTAALSRQGRGRPLMVAKNGRSAMVSSALEEVRGLRRQVREGRNAVEPLGASLRLRLYFAERDLFLAEAAATVFALRRARKENRSEILAAGLSALEKRAESFQLALESGQAAAEAMWRRTRAAKARSQNREILQRDRTRLSMLKKWIRMAARDIVTIDASTPVCGAWQLQFVVVNDRPALQRVSVESRADDGTWVELHARYTIEFQAAAAKPRASIRRIFTTPVPTRDGPLRLVLKGLGEVGIQDVILTNGIEAYRLRSARRARFRLGRRAPRRGFPDVRQVQDVRMLSCE